MKAIQCREYGLPATLEFSEVQVPTPADHEVLIQVKAVGINFPDVLIIQNKYQFKPTLPFSPGGEVSGTIQAVGRSVNNLKVGDSVIALCGWGGLAEFVNVKASRVFIMPPGVNSVQGASTLYTYGTSYHALKDRAQLSAGEAVLVLGAGGGVGLAAVQLGNIMGATVIAAASGNDKLNVCKKMGAHHVINYSTEDLRTRIKEITGERGVDVVYDPVGGSLAEQALRSMAWKGRYLVVGFASGIIPSFAANLPLLKGASIVGVFWGSFAEREPERNAQNFSQLAFWVREGKINQHIHNIYSLEQAPQALQDLMDRKVIGKAIVQIAD
ncbi:MAG: NADPH:quinone oxidoreductase family protein [Cyclobacteriaceae bacterium]|nr:NADPH:quinone oxidoreductase family protein [Cyclobacteriaceae bacterium]